MGDINSRDMNASSSIPTGEEAHGASRIFSTHPHVAGSSQDFVDAMTMLDIFSKDLDVRRSENTSIFPAGSPESQKATRGLSSLSSNAYPRAWIDVYYPELDTPLSQSLEVISPSEDEVLWKADLVEDGDPLDPDAHSYKDAVPTWHGYSAHGEVTGPVRLSNTFISFAGLLLMSTLSLYTQIMESKRTTRNSHPRELTLQAKLY